MSGSPAPDQIRVGWRFDDDAATWDAGYEGANIGGHRRRSRTEAAARLLGEGPGSLLEVGMGSGHMLAILVRHRWTVTGIDVAPAMVELARARLSSADVKLRVGSAEALPWADGEFDAAVAVGVLGYTDVGSATGELARVVRPGGRLVIGFSNRAAPIRAWRRGVAWPVGRALTRLREPASPRAELKQRAIPLRQIHQRLQESGLRVERVETVGAEVLPDPLDRLLPGLAYGAARRAERVPGLRRALGSDRLVLARRD